MKKIIMKWLVEAYVDEKIKAAFAERDKKQRREEFIKRTSKRKIG